MSCLFKLSNNGDPDDVAPHHVIFKTPCADVAMLMGQLFCLLFNIIIICFGYFQRFLCVMSFWNMDDECHGQAKANQ